LKLITQLMSVIGSNGMYYLAAAVSDFFIPNDKMVQHKIQSHNSNLVMEFEQVPKMIQPLVKHWAKGGLIISFKLETDPCLLLEKSRASLSKYGHLLVIGNVLSTRKSRVDFITETTHTPIILGESAKEIESIIVNELIQIHNQWIINSEES
jgi:phosphopantothenate-cysteine ligase